MPKAIKTSAAGVSRAAQLAVMDEQVETAIFHRLRSMFGGKAYKAREAFKAKMCAKFLQDAATGARSDSKLLANTPTIKDNATKAFMCFGSRYHVYAWHPDVDDADSEMETWDGHSDRRIWISRPKVILSGWRSAQIKVLVTDMRAVKAAITGDDRDASMNVLENGKRRVAVLADGEEGDGAEEAASTAVLAGVEMAARSDGDGNPAMRAALTILKKKSAAMAPGTDLYNQTEWAIRKTPVFVRALRRYDAMSGRTDKIIASASAPKGGEIGEEELSALVDECLWRATIEQEVSAAMNPNAVDTVEVAVSEEEFIVGEHALMARNRSLGVAELAFVNDADAASVPNDGGGEPDYTSPPRSAIVAVTFTPIPGRPHSKTAFDMSTTRWLHTKFGFKRLGLAREDLTTADLTIVYRAPDRYAVTMQEAATRTPAIIIAIHEELMRLNPDMDPRVSFAFTPRSIQRSKF